jgi:hypothetical protein
MVVLLTLLVIALVFCLIAGFLGGLAVGIGFLLKACVPVLQLGHAIIAGCVIAVTTVYFCGRLISRVGSEADDGTPDDHPVFVLPKDFFRHLPGGSKPRRKRK